ncbi:MAG: 4-hydroxy-tetrahydrodipicolinate synthase [Rubrivivax sp.]
MFDASGIWIPLVTPLRSGAVDRPALARLVRHLATQGVAGFVACGSTGEAAMLSVDEQDVVLATTLDAAGGLPVLMGLAGVQPDAVARRSKDVAAGHPGVAGFLLAPPAYVKPSQGGLIDFFATVADAAPRPLVLYDVPARTGVRIETATLLQLAGHARIVAVKDCSGDRAAAESLLADGRLALLGGNDNELFDQLARGAAGAIVASAHVATADFVALHRAVVDHRLDEARALWRRLAPLTHVLFAEPNPAPVKGVLARQGWIADELRAPMQPAGAVTVDAACALISRR